MTNIRTLPFTLAMIAVVAYLAAVWFVLVLLWPWVALAATFAFPAAVRTVILGQQRGLKGEMGTVGEHVELFVVSLYAVGLALLAAGAAFAAAMLMMGAALSSWGLASEAARSDWSFVVGVLASLPVFLLAFWGLTFFPRELP